MCGSSLAKCCSMFWCFVFLFMGIVVLAIGIWFPVDPFVHETLVMEDPAKTTDTLPWRGFVGGLIATGSFCIIVGILGMVASGCRSTGALIAYLAMGGLGVIGGIVLASFGSWDYAVAAVDYLYNDDNNAYFNKTLTDNLKQYYVNEDATTEFEMGWNRYQGVRACCGVENFSNDYQNSAFANASTSPVPWSCCVMSKITLTPEESNVLDLAACMNEASTLPGTYSYLNTEGCGEYIFNTYHFHKLMVVGCVWGAVVLEIVALIISGCLRDNIKVASWTV